MSTLLVGGFGGHGEQLLRIRRSLIGEGYFALLESGFHWDYPDHVFYTDRVVDYHKSSSVRSAINFFKATISAYKIIKNYEIKNVISTGPALSVPICLVAKLLGRKVLHIESWSRINTTSNSTRLILNLRIADVVVYQYKEHVLAGRKRCEYWGHL